MKNKWILTALLVMTSAVLMAGCGKKAATESTDPQEILAEAEKVMADQKLRASEIEKIYSYDDGTEETENVLVIFDADKGIREEKTEYEMGFSFTTYNVKENGKYYVYLQESGDEEHWIRYEEELQGEDSSYEYYAKGVDFSFSEEEGYCNVEYSNEGKETVENVDAIKILVKADIGVAGEDEEAAVVTREVVLEENGWTEDEVALVEGFSEIIDNYVAANASIDEGSIRYEQYIWVNAETYAVVKMESKTILDNSENASEANLAIEEFNNEYWKMEMVHNDLQAGASEKEAVAALEEAIKELEAGAEDDYYEYYPSQTKETVIERFLTGNDIPEMDQLPTEYEEMTEEEYYNSVY